MSASDTRCDFCHEPFSQFGSTDEYGDGAAVRIARWNDDGYGIVAYANYDYSCCSGALLKAIAFCPFCGRPLVPTMEEWSSEDDYFWICEEMRDR